MVVDSAKANAAKAALPFIKDRMVVGLGSGSTAAIFIGMLGALAGKRGWALKCIPTSEDSRSLALKAGLQVVGLDAVRAVDVAVDGADLVDGEGRLIKGGGGCLAREKVVAYAAKRFVCIADESKLRPAFAGTVPIEVLPFAHAQVAREVKKRWGAAVRLRMGSGKCGPIVTDNGNYILDAEFGKVGKPEALECELQCVPGVVANGIFARKKPVVIIGGKKSARVLRP